MQPTRRIGERVENAEDAEVAIGSNPKNRAADTKTVRRWLRGRTPRGRYRTLVAEALGTTEQELWPELDLQVSGRDEKGEILAAYAVEFGAVGALAAVAGVGFGAAAAFPIVTEVFGASWSVDWSGIALLLAGAAALTLAGGLVAALAALAQRPAATLRES